MHTILGLFDLDIDLSFLGFSYLEHIAFITNKFPQICLMLDQFLWEHSSRYCGISCFNANCTVCFFQCKSHVCPKG